MIICMLNRGDLPDLDLQRYPSMDSQEKMALIKDYKQTYSLETMCQVINEPDLCDFVKEVERLGFKSQPNYDRLRVILQGLIMNEK
jgi:hypothetical protein